MKRFDRYLAGEVLRFTFLVALVLTVLGALFSFIEQQSDIGVGTYGMADALLVTALLVPKQSFQLLPIAALIGALLGLGNLARGSELVVLRAAGVSVARMAVAVAGAGVVVVAVAVVLGEFLAPPLEAYAENIRTFGKYANFSFAGNAGIWLKDGDRMLNVREQGADASLGGITVYTLETGADGHQRLAKVAHAGHAEAAAPSGWRLRDFTETQLDPEGVRVRRAPLEPFASAISSDLIGAAVQDPGTLPIRGLYRYVGHLRRNGLEARAWEVALWSRVARTLSTILLAVLAVPFVFGPLRSSGAGSRTAIGIGIGVVFVLVNRTLETSGDVYGLSPLLVAWAPVVLLGIVASVGIIRVR
jgi:lipopolysaccharide export system permease protein